VGPRPRDLRVGKESKNKELEKRLDWWKEKEITNFCYSWSNL
jgi:hypothetical protein